MGQYSQNKKKWNQPLIGKYGNCFEICCVIDSNLPGELQIRYSHIHF